MAVFPATPFNIILFHLGWTQIPSSFTITISSQVSMGGAGVLGDGSVQDLVAQVGVASIGVNDPVPVASVLQGGAPGVAYSETISAQGGTSPYTYSVISGSLPTGLSLNPSTGVISGTPTATGTSSFTIQVTDANSNTGSQAFSITIAASSGGGGGAYVFLN